jgi:hypothetical protein
MDETGASPASSGKTLEYAPAPGTATRRLRKWAIALAPLAAAGAALWVWRQDVRYAADRLPFLYAQHRCLAFDPPHARVAYEEDPTRVQALRSEPEYLTAWHPDGRPAATMWWPKAVREWPEVSRYGWLSTGPALKMKTPKGHRVLVFSTAAYRRDMPDGVEIRVEAVEPATWPGASSRAAGMATFLVKPPRDRDASVRRQDVPPVRIYAGRVDPADPSHFTVDYEGGGRRGFMEGRVLDPDADRTGVKFQWGCRTTGWAGH